MISSIFVCSLVSCHDTHWWLHTVKCDAIAIKCSVISVTAPLICYNRSDRFCLLCVLFGLFAYTHTHTFVGWFGWLSLSSSSLARKCWFIYILCVRHVLYAVYAPALPITSVSAQLTVPNRPKYKSDRFIQLDQLKTVRLKDTKLKLPQTIDRHLVEETIFFECALHNITRQSLLKLSGKTQVVDQNWNKNVSISSSFWIFFSENKTKRKVFNFRKDNCAKSPTIFYILQEFWKFDVRFIVVRDEKLVDNSRAVVYCDAIDVGATGYTECPRWQRRFRYAKIVWSRVGGASWADMPEPRWPYDIHSSAPCSPWHCQRMLHEQMRRSSSLRILFEWQTGTKTKWFDGFHARSTNHP